MKNCKLDNFPRPDNILESVFICMAPSKKIDPFFRAARASEMTGMANIENDSDRNGSKCSLGCQ